MITSIYLFIIFKFAPKIIDNSSSKFWHKSVALLNKQRAKTGNAFYLWRFKKLYIRDVYAIPMKSHFYYAKWHPFCLKKTHIN